MTEQYNLLDEPLLGIEDERGDRSSVSLPALLERLSHGRPTEMTAMQAHQQHAVHAFLVQLAALALARAGVNDVAHDHAAWRELLLAAAKEDGAGAEAFSLIVADLAKPAFLQPPVPEGTLAALKNEHARPNSELDVLITAKNHDLKIDRLDDPTVEHWNYALITLQTMQGFLGAGNYGIARMNGGFSSRPCVAFSSDQSMAGRFLRDTTALLGARTALLQASFGFGAKGHLGLVWCAPWDGATSLGFRDLDPFFIEICRRIRLVAAPGGSIRAHRGSSKVARIEAKEAAGNTGDAWTPIARKDGKARTLPPAGFTYQEVHALLFDEYVHGAAGEHRPGEDRVWLGQALVRGQGKTEGYHERWLPVPAKARSFFARTEDRAKLGERSRAWLGFAKDARLKILKPAILTLLQGAPDKLKFDDDRAESHLRHLDAAIDEVFFKLLFDHANASQDDADRAFQLAVAKLAETQLDRAAEHVPMPSARRWRAETKARVVFHGACRKLFALAFPRTPQTDAPANPDHGGSR